MTHPTSAWDALADDVEQALLDLPLDGLLELLLPRTTLTVTWLLPGQALLELSGAPAGAAARLHRAGWSSRRAGAWALPCLGEPSPSARRRAARTAGEEAARVLRDVLQAPPEDVELWAPNPPDPLEPDPATEAQQGAPW